jgi:hypothetical protein
VSEPLAIASFKLNFVEPRVRIVPARGRGPLVEPGIDLVGAEAAEVLALAIPLIDWLKTREAARVRALSLDTERGRLLVTFEAGSQAGVFRIDPKIDASASAHILALAGPLLERLGAIAPVKLAARAAQMSQG